MQANIKGKASNPEKRLGKRPRTRASQTASRRKGLGKKAKNQNLTDRLKEKDSSSEHGLILYEHHD